MKSAEEINEELSVERLSLPSRPEIERVEYRDHTDSLGDPAVQVFVILSEKARESDRTVDKLRPIEDAIRTALNKAGVGRWPYFWFRKPSEQRRAEQAACA